MALIRVYFGNNNSLLLTNVQTDEELEIFVIPALNLALGMQRGITEAIQNMGNPTMSEAITSTIIDSMIALRDQLSRVRDLIVRIQENTLFMNMSFNVPISYVKPELELIKMEYHKRTNPFLGINLSSMTSENLHAVKGWLRRIKVIDSFLDQIK